MELISIVVPVYNVEIYLKRCLESILLQTYKNLDIVLVDDGSTDSSRTICDSYQQSDERIRVLHQENRGLSGARNAGMNLAQGKYIVFVDSDDWLPSYAIERLYTICKKNNVAVVVGQLGDLLKENPYKLKIYNGWSPDLLEKSSACGTLFLKQTIERIPFVEGALHEDEAWTYKALYAAREVAVTSEILYIYEKDNENSITRSKYNKKRLQLFEFLDEKLSFFEDKKEWVTVQLVQRQYICVLISNYNMMREIDNDKKDRKYILTKSWNILKKDFWKNGEINIRLKIYFLLFFVKVFFQTLCYFK